MDLSQKRYIFKGPNLSLFIFQIIDNQLSSSPKLPKVPQNTLTFLPDLKKSRFLSASVYCTPRQEIWNFVFLYIYNKQKWKIATKGMKKCTVQVIQKSQSMVHSSSEVEDTTINSYANQDAKRWWLTRLWNPSSLITPTTLSGSSFQVLTAALMNVLSVEWVLKTGTESAWLGIDRLDRVKRRNR